ncbi:unnamed protein product, partial [Coregonus sp. 'balchen']
MLGCTVLMSPPVQWSLSLPLSELYSLQRSCFSLGRNFLVLTSRPPPPSSALSQRGHQGAAEGPAASHHPGPGPDDHQIPPSADDKTGFELIACV